MKLLKTFIIGLLIIVTICGIAAVGGYIYVRSTYGIDLFNTASQLKILTQEVEEDKLCPNAFKDEDFIDLKNIVNSEFDGLIKVEDGKGYNGYFIDYKVLLGESFSKPISFSEKQVGALTQLVFYEKNGGVVKIGDKETKISLLQIDFSNIVEDGSADFNIVYKLDLSPFKIEMDKFPYYFFKKYIPTFLYISSTVRVEKSFENGFEYELSNIGLRLNNLNQDETSDLFHTLDVILKIGSAYDINMNIGTIATNALIGNKDNIGFAYSLKNVGATKFYFSNIITDGHSIDFFGIV